jgi:predicted AAA+ superfamily ATPase
MTSNCLLVEVLSHLTGDALANTPIIRLETSFGGGKTHNLIALYHVANGRTDRSSLQGFVQDAQQLPDAGAVDIAGVISVAFSAYLECFNGPSINE